MTSTAVTLPDTAKFRLSCCAGSTVPEVETVCCMVPVVTSTTWVVMLTGGEAEPLVPSQIPTPAPAARTIATRTMTIVRLGLKRRNRESLVTTGTRSVTSSGRCGTRTVSGMAMATVNLIDLNVP